MSSVLERVVRSMVLHSDPAEWVRRTQLNKNVFPAVYYDPDDWQVRYLTDPALWKALCEARQVGKSQVVGWDSAHHMIYTDNAVVILVSRAQRQSKQLMKYVREALQNAGVEFATDNAFDIVLENGSEVHAVPGSGENIRGFSRVTKLVIDEAAFCPDELYYAVEPMVNISGGQTILLSSADATFGFFYHIMTGDDPKWSRYKITAYQCPRYDKADLDDKRKNLPDRIFRREYLAEFVDPIGTLIPEELRKAAEVRMDDPFDTATRPKPASMGDFNI